MNLVEVVSKFRFLDEDEILNELNLGIYPEEIDACMAGSLDIKSEVVFFPINASGKGLSFEKDGILYWHLFPISLFYEVMQDTLNSNNNISNSDLAKRLIHYRINDA